MCVRPAVSTYTNNCCVYAGPTQMIGNGLRSARAPGDGPRPRQPGALNVKKGGIAPEPLGTAIKTCPCGEYTYLAMKGHNNCAWLKVGELGTCGKSCCQTFCKVHLARIRKGSNIPAPCRCCGKGVQSEIEVCRACGRDKIRHQHIALEKRARRQFDLVLAQLLVTRTPI